MLARRLLVFALILLVVTALSSALAPPQRTVDPPPAPPAQASADGALVERAIDGSRTAPTTVVVQEGDLLRLTVSADEAGSVELRGLGDVRAVDPQADAVFDVLPSEPGSYPVLLLGEDRTIGTVRVVSREE